MMRQGGGMMKRRGTIAISMALAMGLLWSADGAEAQMTIQRVSVSSTGEQGNSGSESPAISGDGRYITYRSDATNLVAGDTNTLRDIFVHDLQTGTTERISLNSNEEQADGGSDYPELSHDGRYVAFQSYAGNLDPADGDSTSDIFVRDRTGGTTELVSVDSNESKGNGYSSTPSLSADGRYVAFASQATNLAPADTDTINDIFVRDRTGGTTELVSVDSDELKGNGYSYNPSLSADGRYVAFSSASSNLSPADPDATEDIFVRDRTGGTTELISMNSDESKGNAFSKHPIISSDGRYVLFESWATNLVAGDDNGFSDIFLRDRQLNTTERVSIGDGEEQGNGATLGYGGGLASDGRYVVFPSNSSNMVTDDTNGRNDIFRRDRAADGTIRVNLSSAGDEMTDGWFYGAPVIAGNGMVMAFATDAASLVANDTNTSQDIFVVTMGHHTLKIILAGRGTVSSSPAGIDCGADCEEVYEVGTGVVLTSTPEAGSKFRGWSGDPDCADGAVTMNSDINCTATFTSFPWIMFNNILTGNGEK